MKIQIFIVEDEPEWIELYQQELRLYSFFEVTGAASSLEKAVAHVKADPPDIVLMDLSLSNNNFEGITAITEILQYVDTKIVVITSHFDETLINRAFRAGAVEYLLKYQINRLPVVIQEVYDGKSPHLILARSFAHYWKENQFRSLSKTEKEILQLKKKGYSHSQIERMTFKAANTLKHQISSILKKLNVASCCEAIRKFKDFIE
jgi:DNA-binding NarL/FixJ family response regulator